MIKKLSFIFLITVFLCLNTYALDWKALHETADTKSSKSALKILEAGPDLKENLYILALTYLNEHKNSQAEDNFKKILVLYPETIEAKWGLAEILRRQGKFSKASKELEKIIKSNPGFAPAYISLAYVKYTEFDFNSAVRLALAVMKKGRQKADLSSYTRAYLVYAGAKGMIASRGGPLSKLINGTKVLPNLKKAQKLQPGSPAVLFGLGSFYFLAPAIAGGSLDKALDCLKRAVEADPLFADAYVRLAQVYKMKGDAGKYQTYLNKAREIDPDNRLALDEANKICNFNCVTVEE